jgi:hypothetical protein
MISFYSGSKREHTLLSILGALLVGLLFHWLGQLNALFTALAVPAVVRLYLAIGDRVFEWHVRRSIKRHLISSTSVLMDGIYLSIQNSTSLSIEVREVRMVGENAKMPARMFFFSSTHYVANNDPLNEFGMTSIGENPDLPLSIQDKLGTLSEGTYRFSAGPGDFHTLEAETGAMYKLGLDEAKQVLSPSLESMQVIVAYMNLLKQKKVLIIPLPDRFVRSFSVQMKQDIPSIEQSVRDFEKRISSQKKGLKE